MFRPLCLVGAVVAASISGFLRADDGTQNERFPELNSSRQIGWQVTTMVMEKLESSDPDKFEGIHIYLKEFREKTKGITNEIPPHRWPAMDIDSLVTHNPKFWRAYYEIAPADPGLTLWHAGLLQSAGEGVRASHVLLIAQQRPGVPDEIRKAYGGMTASIQRVVKPPVALVKEGIELHDQQDYEGAIRKYQAAVELWPQFGDAHYELGYTHMTMEMIAAGKKPLAQSVVINSDFKVSKEVDAAYTRARRHNPFQYMAYQGSDQNVIDSLTPLLQRVLPTLNKIQRAGPEKATDEDLNEFSLGLQDANHHDLALLVRQVMVARRGRYLADDHPFITANLRELAPGAETEIVLGRLADDKMEVRQLIPVASKIKDE